MNVCIPAVKDHGLKSPVSAHFGSAPLFVLVDTVTRAHRVVVNHDLHHVHGMCQPLRAIAGEPVDAVVVGGIGRGALLKLRAAGIQVLLSRGGTVEDVCAALDAGALPEVTVDGACGGHGSGAPGGHTCGGGHHDAP